MKKDENLKTLNELADKIKAKKCDLTKEQFREAASEILDLELSLDELDGVAGGTFFPLAPSGNS